MHTENSILIQADSATIFPLAAAVERWPSFLPHYRWVRVLDETPERRRVEMAAWRDIIPVWWRAEQRLYPAEPRINFRHVQGLTTGMEVDWLFTARLDGMLVTIRHDLRLPWPLIGPIAGDWVVGPLFVSYIADLTLRGLKRHAEARAVEGQLPRATEL